MGAPILILPARDSGLRRRIAALVAVPVMFIGLGLGVDGGRVMLERARLQADATAAAAAVLQQGARSTAAETGRYDVATGVFTATAARPNAVRVTLRRVQPLVFGRAIGRDGFAMSHTAIAYR